MIEFINNPKNRANLPESIYTSEVQKRFLDGCNINDLEGEFKINDNKNIPNKNKELILQWSLGFKKLVQFDNKMDSTFIVLCKFSKNKWKKNRYRARITVESLEYDKKDCIYGKKTLIIKDILPNEIEQYMGIFKEMLAADNIRKIYS